MTSPTERAPSAGQLAADVLGERADEALDLVRRAR